MFKWCREVALSTGLNITDPQDLMNRHSIQKFITHLDMSGGFEITCLARFRRKGTEILNKSVVR